MDTTKLVAEFARRGLSREQVADYMGISRKTLYNKLQSGVFTNCEIKSLARLLMIEDVSFFFEGSDD